MFFTLPNPYNAVRGHRTGANNSGAEDYLRGKTNKKQKIIHTITKQSGTSDQKYKNDISGRTYQDTYISYATRVAAETETEETAYEYPQEKDRMQQTMSKSKSKKGKDEKKKKKSTSRTQEDSTHQPPT